MFQKLSCWVVFPPFIALVVVVSCTTVPDNGRKQLNAFQSADKQAELEQMGLDEFEKIKSEKPVSQDPTMTAAVQRVGNHLAPVVPLQNAHWEFVVFEDPTPNAFALPGGKVGVHTGLFQVAQNDAGLAAVIGHELAHVVANHAGERITGQVATAAGVAVLTEVIGSNTGMSTGGKIGTGLGLGGAGVLLSRKNSRSQELEADQIGAIYMARAGYDPREAVELWKRFANFKEDKGSKRSRAFLSTHPLDETRIKSLQSFLPRALAQYQPMPPEGGIPQ
ncbi:MAG: M48 family metallopeptidase [Verrucomicrobiales bacterium]|nr:M48 family metallopeptidase [Verrucomicrobiae bacterium]MCP5553340.1 M48 family metallopeptidase [Akkermansiaceae bacterium]